MNETEVKKYETLEPGIRAFLLEGESLYPESAINFTMAEQRAFYDRYCAHFRKPRPSSVETEDFAVGPVPCRIYRKAGIPRPPVLLYLHGGGYILGGLESHDDICAEIADAASLDVVAVQYRLAPEHPFPAAFEDCWSVLGHLAQDHDRIIVGGDSAGGNLAAALAIRARDEGGPALRGQVLIYPGLGGDTSSGSYVTCANAPGYTIDDVRYYRSVYKGAASKYGAPLTETDYRGLPPAFLVAAGIDPGHDDCIHFAARLEAAGVPALVREEPLLVHAFLRARHMSRPARASFDAITAACASLAHRGQLPEGTT